jgi:galactokinase
VPPPNRSVAFAPGRVNLLGEHTDYNRGLALPFAIAEGVTVRAEATGSGARGVIRACARDLAESDYVALGRISHTPGTSPSVPGAAGSEGADPAGIGDGSSYASAGGRGSVRGWRAFLRGTILELEKAGYPLVGARLEISSTLERGAGLSSSAALEVALCLALIELSSEGESRVLDRIEIAELCARVENHWVGAQTGLLDQLASLFGQVDVALLIDFATLQIQPVPLRLNGWRLVVLDSGERHSHAAGGYNQRRAECARACEFMNIDSLSNASADAVRTLPAPLRARAEHVLSENTRVMAAVRALGDDDLPALGTLLNAAHASLRDLYEISTPAVEHTVQRMLKEGAVGARLMGGGFGGSVLGLFPPGASLPAGAREVCPGAGAHLLDAG